MDPIDDSWRVPGGFPEEHAQRLIELQYALVDMAVAVRAHSAELYQAPQATPLAQENYRLAVTLTAAQLDCKLLALEQVYARLAGLNRLVSQALIRCESFDAGRGAVGPTQTND